MATGGSQVLSRWSSQDPRRVLPGLSMQIDANLRVPGREASTGPKTQISQPRPAALVFPTACVQEDSPRTPAGLLLTQISGRMTHRMIWFFSLTTGCGHPGNTPTHHSCTPTHTCSLPAGSPGWPSLWLFQDGWHHSQGLPGPFTHRGCGTPLTPTASREAVVLNSISGSCGAGDEVRRAQAGCPPGTGW